MTRYCDKYPCTEEALPGGCYCKRHQEEFEREKMREARELYGSDDHRRKRGKKGRRDHRRP